MLGSATQVFFCEICKNFKNTFFYRTTLVAASEYFRDFSFEVISHSFNDVEIITNSSKNKVLLQSKECLQGTCIAKFSLKIYPMLNFAAFHCG